MSIEVICPSCDQVHKVKDEAAGKKLRCKGCQEVIPIPAASEPAEADPWDTGDMEEPAPRQAPRQRKPQPAKAAKPSRPARTRSGDGMPITIMASIGICGLFILIVVVSSVINIMAGEKAQAGGAVIRLLVNISVIKGLLGRSNRTRWNAVVLDCLGLVIGVSCIGSLLFLSGNPQVQQQAPPGTVPALMLIFAV